MIFKKNEYLHKSVAEKYAASNPTDWLTASDVNRNVKYWPGDVTILSDVPEPQTLDFNTVPDILLPI